MDAQRRERKRRRSSTESINPAINWFLWRPCTGAGDACPPLAKWSDMLDGTYTIDDVQAMHAVMDDLVDSMERALSHNT
ncbi:MULTISPECIES: hypothetical protein [Photorhabdus]|uniref:Uncharacterized protein n=1 Tax=Photorhabdus kayaii TaxID=230088 RepID=A0ABX0AT07_9GAMM|nr:MULTISPECIES: hypothetical protein [Photorhabdus]MCT8353941.1 hypothetical protein [Photorhabdus kayaii]NDL23912.1 hypothetical protein [Photorhabdus kayaii]